jgi:hypothetical protein
MLELSLHVLDIAENSTRAEAKHIFITLREDTGEDRLTLEIRDDGTGMTEDVVARVLDPFYTTKKVRRVGLGLPMLAEAAGRTGGELILESKPGAGTEVRVTFGLSHLDRQPLGDMAGTLVTLLTGHPETEFIYRHERDGRTFLLDTREVREEIGDIPLNHPEILAWVRLQVEEGLTEIEAGA